MSARPLSNDLDDEPETVEFGIVALEARVDERDVSFPVSASELKAAHGDVKLAVDPSGKKMRLDDAIEACETDHFASRQELLNAMHPVFEQRRSSGLIDRLHALLPL